MFSSSAPLSQDAAERLFWHGKSHAQTGLIAVCDFRCLINHCEFAIVYLIHPVGLCPNLLNMEFFHASGLKGRYCFNVRTS